MNRPVNTQAETASNYNGLVEANDAVLVVVDVQAGFLAKVPAERSEALLGNVRFLSEVAVRLDMPVLVTVEEAALNGPLHPDIRAALGAGAVERDKTSFGLCGQDDLRETLQRQERRTVVLVGLETDVCVLQSAVGLMALGFRTLMVSDAVAAPDPDHALGLERAHGFGIELVHTKGLYYELARSLAGLAVLQAPPAIRPPPNSRL